MKTLIIGVLLLTCLKSFSQQDPEREKVDAFMKRFNLKLDTVYWLCQYDNIAWWTSDSVYATSKDEQAKLGSEWFCFKENNVWHALYGKYNNDQFQMVYHYEVDTNVNIRRVYSNVDTLLANSYSRALVNAAKMQREYPDSLKVSFNQYIRRNENQTLSVWFLPAFSKDAIAIYGGEFYYTFDATGNNLISKSEYSQGYRGFETDPKKEIWLNYRNVDEPTLGSIFFIWYYRKYFDKIVADAKKFKSTLFHDESKGYYWVHAVKD